MKKMLMLVFVFLLLSTVLVLAASGCRDTDSGEDPDTYGYVTFDGKMYSDSCKSTVQILEYYCDGNNVANYKTSCDYCFDGVCFEDSCSQDSNDELYCNPYLGEWCQGQWTDSGYCSDPVLGCYLVDSSCFDSGYTNQCEEGACDYNAHAYCVNDEWYTDYFCDDSYCGQDTYAQGYCFCDPDNPDEEVEVSCGDGEDNDCDGDVDCNDLDCSGEVGCECTEGDEQSCGVDEGVCGVGVQSCVEGSWGVCMDDETVVSVPSTELCDELDNDCDGEVDEECSCELGDTRDCGSNTGVCKAGVQICQEDATWSVCYGEEYGASQIEECDGLDNDCDGLTDEGCECIVGSEQSCGSDVGYCKSGVQVCSDLGEWGECESSVSAFSEVCGDLVDNDCDGLTDFDDDNCNQCASDEHCDEGFVCSSGSCIESVEEGNVDEEVVDEGCDSSIDCLAGFECDRGECVEVGSEESDVGVELEEEEEEEEESSSKSDFDFGEETEEEGVDLFVFLFPVVAVVLILFLVAFWYVKRKGGKKEVVQKKEAFKVKMSGSQPVVSKKPSVLKSFKKSFVDKKLEDSFKQSGELFKK